VAAIYRIKLNITFICLADSDYSLSEGGRASPKMGKKKERAILCVIRIHTYTYVEWHILLHNVNDRAEQTEIAHVARGGGEEMREEMREKINTLSGTIARHTFHNPRDRFDINFVDLIKIHGFRLQSVRLPCMGPLVGKTSERTSSLTTIVSPHRRRIFLRNLCQMLQVRSSCLRCHNQ